MKIIIMVVLMEERDRVEARKFSKETAPAWEAFYMRVPIWQSF